MRKKLSVVIAMLISLSSFAFAACNEQETVTDYDKVYPDRVVNTYSFDAIGGADVMPIGLYYGPYTPNGSKNGETMPNFTDEYYIKMMVAWFFATALAKQYESTIKYIESGKLDKWVHNKTIQKAIESNRISSDMKRYLRTLKKLP